MITFSNHNKQKLLQFFKLALISGAIFVITVFFLVSLLAWLYRDSIKEHFIAYINKGLQTEVLIEDISIDVIRSFPLAAISLKNVTMAEVLPANSPDTLFSASRIRFQFSLMDLIRRNYAIRQAVVQNATVRMKDYANGTNNYTFWSRSEDIAAGQGSLEFMLSKVFFDDLDFTYQNQSSGHLLSFSDINATLAGNFSANNYLLNMVGEMMVTNVTIDHASFVDQTMMDFDFDLDVSDHQLFSFRKGLFALGSHAFNATGNVDVSGDSPYVDLRIGAQRLRLEDFISDLPSRFAKYFDGYRSKGEFYFDASITGHLNHLINPYVHATFGINGGELYHSKAGLDFREISFDASYDNGSKRKLSTSSLMVKEFKAVLDEGQIQADVGIVNFDQPSLDVKLFSNITADEWQRFLQSEKIREASGELLIDIEFRGKLDENRKFTAYHFMASQVRGAVESKNLSFRLTGDPLHYHSIDADFLFNNNDVIVNHFSGHASTSHFNMKGFFRNVLPWLFLDDQRLFVDASLSSTNLNFNELLQHSVNESDTTYRLTLSDKIDFHMVADVDQLAFRKFDAAQVRGTLSMKDQMFYASNISLATMKGTIEASGYINGKNESHLIMGCEARVENVDVYDLFYQMGNFGQQSIGYENLRGRITANTRFVSRWSPFLEIDWNTLETTADIKVENGELINYKPMLALSRFIRVGDLNQVKFSTLENQIRIKDQKIIIPDMEVNSNAINIRLLGEHTFDNEINYRLQVLLSDLLARNNRESRNPQEQYGDIIDDGLGRTTLFLLVTGTIDDPVFRYDRKGVAEKLRKDFRQERQNLINDLRTEFGIVRGDTLPDGTPVPPTQKQQERKEIEEREKGKFIIEWDED